MASAVSYRQLHIVDDFPAELVMMVAAPLPTWGQRALMLTCKTLHNIVAPLLYRDIKVNIGHVPRPRGVRLFNYSFLPATRVLSCLLLSAKNAETAQAYHCYVQYVVSLLVKSHMTPDALTSGFSVNFTHRSQTSRINSS